MAAVGEVGSKSVYSKVETKFIISKNYLVEKIKKAAYPLFIILGLGLAEIGATFFDVNLVVVGLSFLAAAIGLIAIGILKIIKGFKIPKNQDEPVENKLSKVDKSSVEKK